MSETSAPDAGAREDRAQQLRQRLIDGFNLTPFNQHIGLRLTHLDAEGAKAVIDMQSSLVGNAFKQILHGGVIATLLDSVAGAAAMSAAYQHLKGETQEEKMRRMSQLSTVDMRVDYLLPGRGQRFEASGRVVRIGSKLCATQMELRNEEGTLIATGNAVFHY